MSRICPHTFPLYRISVAMQRKLEFIFAKVKPGTHERHLDWFKKQVWMIILLVVFLRWN